MYNQLEIFDHLVPDSGSQCGRFQKTPLDRTQVNPKLGIMWDLTRRTTLRAALFRSLTRPLVSSQTIEPTQVAGFNQFFDDTTGTDAWTFGVGLDQKLTDEVLIGAEVVGRKLSVSIEDCSGISKTSTPMKRLDGRICIGHQQTGSLPVLVFSMKSVMMRNSPAAPR